MSSIQIPHPDPNSLAQLLGHKPAKKVPEILWSLYSVERLKLRKNWLHSSLNDSDGRGLRWGKIWSGSFTSVINLHSTCNNPDNTDLNGCNWSSWFVSTLLPLLLFYFLEDLSQIKLFWNNPHTRNPKKRLNLATSNHKPLFKKNSASLEIWIILFPDSTSDVLIWRKLISKLFPCSFILPQTAANKLRRLQTSEGISNK